ncbi:hypothetical protein ACFXDH_00345 [Streptomyces sp. NPDC059467]|uniref:hypothetical protein n=1 Tax=Streptomyces sp. NPDC059467 TaxID=3346844 RepID=UPI0036B996D1
MTQIKDGPDPEILVERWKYVALTLDEADELRARLSEFIAAGYEYARAETVASARELIDNCGVRVVECELAPKGFYGHAVGDTRQGGPVWVTVPRDATGPCLEERVTALLAELHEREPKLIVHDGTEVRQAGRALGVPSWPEVRAAA